MLLPDLSKQLPLLKLLLLHEMGLPNLSKQLPLLKLLPLHEMGLPNLSKQVLLLKLLPLHEMGLPNLSKQVLLFLASAGLAIVATITATTKETKKKRLKCYLPFSRTE